MKKLVCAVTLGLGAGCMTAGPTIQGAVPFAQMFTETEGRPFECLNYDARTDTCEAITTYVDLGGGRYSTRSRSIFDAAGGAVDVTGTFRASGDQICSDASDYEISLVGDEADFEAELAFAQIETFLRDQGNACLALFRDGDNYTARFVSGPEFYMSATPQRLIYLDAPKALRAPSVPDA